MAKREEKHETLCWGCEKACGRCSWSREFVPVPGWKAIPTKIYQYTSSGEHKHRYHTDSFDVYECPEFEPLKAMNPDASINDLKWLRSEEGADKSKKSRTEEQIKRIEMQKLIYKMLFEENKSVPAVAKEIGFTRSYLYRIKKKGRTENAEN